MGGKGKEQSLWEQGSQEKTQKGHAEDLEGWKGYFKVK